MLNWLNENKEWLFSGGGVALFGWIGTRIFKRKSNGNNNQRIKTGEKSKNYQSGRDLIINNSKDGDSDEK